MENQVMEFVIGRGKLWKYSSLPVVCYHSCNGQDKYCV